MNTFSFGNSLAKTYYNHPELLQREGKQKSRNNKNKTARTTVFTRVSARGAHFILSFQRGALVRGRCSFEGGAH